MTNPNGTMRLVTSSMQSQKTFRLIPASIDCPYVEGIFDPETKILVLLSKERKTTYHMLPKVDDNGDLQRVTGKPRPAPQGQSPKDYREERKTLDSFMEFYVMEKSEIEEIVRSLAINHETYDYKKYTEASVVLAGPPEAQKIELLSK